MLFNIRIKQTLSIVSVISSLFLLLSSASADVLVRAQWTNNKGHIYRPFCLNGWSVNETSVARNGGYKDRISNLRPNWYRIHAAELVQIGHPKSWLNSNGTWNSNKIHTILSNIKGRTDNIVICIPKWPSTIDNSGRLNSNKYTAFYRWCGDLAKIIKARGHFDKVKRFEILNELDNLYNGAEGTYATIVKGAITEMRKHDASDTTYVSGTWTNPWDDSGIKRFMDNISQNQIKAFTYHHYATFSSNTSLGVILDRAKTIADRSITIRNWMNSRNLNSSNLWIDETHMYGTWNLDRNKWMRSNEGAVFLALAFKFLIEKNGSGAIKLFPWNDADGTYGVVSTNGGWRQPGYLMNHFREFFRDSRYVLVNSSNSGAVKSLATKLGSKKIHMIINRSSSTQRIDTNYYGWKPRSNNYRRVTITGSGYSTRSLNLNNRNPPQNYNLPAYSILIYQYND